MFNTGSGMQFSPGKLLNDNGDALSWEGKHVAPVLEVKIRSCIVLVKGGSQYPSLEGGLLKDSIWHVVSSSQRWLP